MWDHIKEGLFWNQSCDHKQNQVEKINIFMFCSFHTLYMVHFSVIYSYAISQKVVCGII
jgi:hypothetical protein